MRSRLQHWKPAHLFWVAGLSNLPITATALALAIMAWHLPESERLPRDVSNAGIWIICFFLAVSFLSEWALRWGLRRRIWPESLLAGPRKVAEHPVMAALTITMAIASIVFFVVTPLRHAALAPLVMVFPLGFLRIRHALRLQGSGPDEFAGLSITSNRHDFRQS